MIVLIASNKTLDLATLNETLLLINSTILDYIKQMNICFKVASELILHEREHACTLVTRLVIVAGIGTVAYGKHIFGNSQRHDLYCS